jgi:hypothetical protein
VRRGIINQNGTISYRVFFSVNAVIKKNDFHVIDTYEHFLDFLRASNLKKGFRSIKTYDFATLYR